MTRFPLFARALPAVLLLAAFPVAAAPTCSPSTSIKHFDYPGAGAIVTTNNLILPTGKALEADGQKLIITGRVVDRNCMPVPEAMVELWQASPFGKWQLASGQDLAASRAVFAGAGRTYTNMDGYFSFITAFPAPSRYATPNVNIRVKAEGLPTYSTALFFAEDVRNDKDKTYQSLSADARKDVSIEMREGDAGGLLGAIEIVMQGKTPYRTY